MMYAPVFELSPKRLLRSAAVNEVLPRRTSEIIAGRLEIGRRGRNESPLMIRLSETRDTQGALSSVPDEMNSIICRTIN